jgi:glycosyltransferase involved in cell wall biosynthesis
MENLKILWLNWRCWLNPAMGGAEVFTREVAKRFAAAGHDVCLFTSEYAGCQREEVVDGVRILRAGGRFSVYLQAARFYRKNLSKDNFDIVIDEINTVPFFAHKFVKKGEKVFALIHQLAREYWLYEMPFPLGQIGFYFLEDRWLREYKALPTLTVSNSTKEDLRSLGFNNVSLIPEGLNFSPLSSVGPKSQQPVIVFAGRLKQAKRPDHAIIAFKHVKKVIPDAELWILGDGPFRNQLEKLACPGVTFFGNLGNIERRNLIAQSWVLINPSVREGWGLNIIEANALGTPTVVYDVPGLRDSVINGETGLFAQAGNVMALSNQLIAILKNHKLREKISKNALAYSSKFDWENTYDSFQKAILN